VRAQRRMDEVGQTLWLVLQATGASAALNVYWQASVLMRLP
jgi:hypothetical protein